MRLDIDISQHQLPWDQLLERARFAEDAGFEGAWVFDHFKPLYGDAGGPCLEAWTLLAALAAATVRIRLGALVTGVTYRHPSILAAEAVTVDHISGGRLDIGLGAAWHDGEHRELGIDFPGPGERSAMLAEAVEVLELLMTTDGGSFDGRHFRLQDATYNPKPVQDPKPPLWIGGGGERRTIPLAARKADVWHGFGDLESLRHKSHLVDHHAEQAGRDPAEIGRATALSLSEDFDSVRARAEALREAGFDYLTVSWPSEGRARLEEFIETVMEDLEDL